MNPFLAILVCTALFVVLGWLVRERPGTPSAGSRSCGGCAHPCDESEQDDARSC
jgi:hypothetical protein